MDDSALDAILTRIHDLPPRHVSEASTALTGQREHVPCGRPTRRGTSCAATRARFTPACSTHATAEERAAAHAEEARLTTIVAEWQASLTPACHGWPVTEEIRRKVAALACVDDELLQSRHGQDVLWKWQRGRCAICGGGGQQWGPDWWDSSDAVVDHDHRTALVRGWLCRSCNTTEPHTDRGDFAKYRERPPAVILGIAVRYEHPWYGLVEPQEWLDPSLHGPSQSAAYRLAGRWSRHMPEKETLL